MKRRLSETKSDDDDPRFVFGRRTESLSDFRGRFAKKSRIQASSPSNAGRNVELGQSYSTDTTSNVKEAVKGYVKREPSETDKTDVDASSENIGTTHNSSEAEDATKGVSPKFRSGSTYDVSDKEGQRKADSDNLQSNAMKKSAKRTYTCQRCGQQGHSRRSCAQVARNGSSVEDA
ncbi:hypothetical protein IW262DRAFT_1421227 [Armillaria fumosa]|nr:hypothetical protein IW262DRAFT_1421227 [Armillaria fumosa]